MPEVESPSVHRPLAAESRPRHSQREIADLLATAILRMHADPHKLLDQDSSAVCLAITGNQSVHTNPSYQEGVRQ